MTTEPSPDLSRVATDMPPLGLRLDVSRYQGAIDWPRVAAWRDSSGARVVEVVAKLTAGATYIDARGPEDMRGARAEGLRVGAYHFLTGTNVGAQARNFLDAWGAVREPGDLPPALDVETAHQGQDVAAGALAWLRAVDAASEVRAEVYTGLDFALEHLGGAPELGEYCLWLAAYRDERPPCPPPWVGFRWWQFTSKGRVDGIAGGVDLSQR